MSKPNWANRTVWTRDCLEVMRGMNSESVDLIYLDPPFNSKADYSAPVGSKAAGAHFRDTWTLRDVDEEWIRIMEREHPALFRVLLAAMTSSDKSYLAYMAVRLLEIRRILKPKGSVYLHCDQTMSHYLKITMDAIFGRKQFRNEIIWCYPPKGKGPNFRFPRKHDVLLFYAGDDRQFFRPQHTELNVKQIGKFSFTDENGRRYKEFKGKRTYLDESKGRPVPSWWEDIGQTGQSRTEYLGYPTQKPLALLDRIIRASSDAGDMVLDPFCGCATSMVAANSLSRQWAGIDLSPKAGELVLSRMRDRGELFGKTILRTDIPKRTDLGPLPKPRTHRRRLFGDQEGRCNWCQVEFSIGNLEVDHIIAKTKGGTDHLDNLQLLCGRCNRIKGDRGMEYLRTKLQIAKKEE